MLMIILQYIRIIYGIKIAKIQGYEGIEKSELYPKNADRLRAKGYRICEPSLLRDSYIIKW